MPACGRRYAATTMYSTCTRHVGRRIGRASIRCTSAQDESILHLRSRFIQNPKSLSQRRCPSADAPAPIRVSADQVVKQHETARKIQSAPDQNSDCPTSRQDLAGVHRKTHEHTTLTQGLLGPRRTKKQARAVAAAALWVVCEHKTQAPPAPSNRKERPQRRAPYEFV